MAAAALTLAVWASFSRKIQNSSTVWFQKQYQGLSPFSRNSLVYEAPRRTFCLPSARFLLLLGFRLFSGTV